MECPTPKSEISRPRETPVRFSGPDLIWDVMYADVESKTLPKLGNPGSGEAVNTLTPS